MATTLVRSATSIRSVSDGWFITKRIQLLADSFTRRTTDTLASMQRRTIRFRPIYPGHASREPLRRELPRRNNSLVVHRFATTFISRSSSHLIPHRRWISPTLDGLGSTRWSLDGEIVHWIESPIVDVLWRNSYWSPIFRPR